MVVGWHRSIAPPTWCCRRLCHRHRHRLYAAINAMRCSTCSAATSCEPHAPGLERTRALITYDLRTALILMATFFAYEFALFFVGATFTERSCFGWHGIWVE